MTDPIWLVVVFLLVLLGAFLVWRRMSGENVGRDAGLGAQSDTGQRSMAERTLHEQPVQATPADHRVVAAAKPVAEVTSISSAKPTTTGCGHSEGGWNTIPQDATLRRHYLTHVRSMVESLAPPCPSDSVLRRHHEHLVAAWSDSCLAESGQLEALVREYHGLRRQMA
jgi:hypothetical protein